jgi:hypothetical protein
LHPNAITAPIRLAASAAGALALVPALAACTGVSDTPADAVGRYYDDGHPQIVIAFLFGGEGKVIERAATAHFCDEYVETFVDFAQQGDGQIPALASNLTDLTEDDVTYDYTIIGTEEDGDTATVEVEVTGPTLPDSTITTETKTLELIVEDDEWKICGPVV